MICPPSASPKGDFLEIRFGTVLLGLSFVALALCSRAGEFEPGPQRSAPPPPTNDRSQVVTTRSATTFDFDLSSGFVLGPINGQNGWYSTNLTDPVISSDNPYRGNGHLRLAGDDSVSQGTSIDVACPIQPTPAATRNSVSVWLNISQSNGADYVIGAWNNTEYKWVWNIHFSRLGDISVSNGAPYAATGDTWIADQYQNLTVVTDPDQGSITVSYAGTQIYSTTIQGASNFEKIWIYHDNYHQTDVGDFDDLVIDQNAPDQDIFADGFETGETNRWSLTFQ